MQPKPKQSYRLVLNSKDKISGSNGDATFNASCYAMIPPEGHKHKYQFAVENFVCESSAGSILAFIPSLTQVDSFSTSTKTENQSVMMTNTNFYSRDIVHSSLGHIVSNVDALRTGILQVKFTDISGNTANISNWSMSIVLWQVDEESSYD